MARPPDRSLELDRLHDGLRRSAVYTLSTQLAHRSAWPFGTISLATSAVTLAAAPTPAVTSPSTRPGSTGFAAPSSVSGETERRRWNWLVSDVEEVKHPRAPAVATVAAVGDGLANPIVPTITNATPVAAVAQSSLTFEVLDSRSFLQSVDVNPGWVDGSLPPPELGMTLRYLELVPSVLLRRNAAASSADTPIEQDLPGLVYFTESGFFRDEPDADDWPEELTAANQESGLARGRVSGTVAGTLGLADHGTRLFARFSDVPAGVRLFVENAPALEPSGGGAPSGALQLVQADANCAGPFAAARQRPGLHGDRAGGGRRPRVLGGALEQRRHGGGGRDRGRRRVRE